MKKINWTEIAIAAPMAISFGSLGGFSAILVVSVALGLLILVAKVVGEKKAAVVPVLVKRNSSPLN